MDADAESGLFPEAKPKQVDRGIKTHMRIEYRGDIT